MNNDNQEIQNTFNFSTVNLDAHHILEASAGTGKTWNICALVIRLLLEKKISIKEILIVTFTEVACNELKVRIRRRIEETRLFINTNGDYELTNDPFKEYLISRSDKKEEDLKQLDIAYLELDEAAIFTIHGFCHKALSLAAFTAGQPFSWTVVTDPESFITDCVNDYWRTFISTNRVASYAPQFVTIKNLWRSTKADLTLLLNKYINRPLIQTSSPLNDESKFNTIADLEEKIRDSFNKAKSAFQNNSELIHKVLESTCLNGRVYNKIKALPDVKKTINNVFILEDNALLINELIARNNNNGLFLATYSQLKKSRKKETAKEKELFNSFDENLEKTKAFFENVDTLFTKATELTKKIKPAIFSHFLFYATEIIKKKKDEERIIFYSDMLSKLHDVLYSNEKDVASNLADGLFKRYPVAMIDEFQDTDALQYQIFSRIYQTKNKENRGSLFLVGDPKQSIYGFRSADIYTYLVAKEKISEGNRHTIKTNFRSTNQYIETLNNIYFKCDSPFLHKSITYPGADTPENKIKNEESKVIDRKPLVIWYLDPDESSGLSQYHAFNNCVREIKRLLSSDAEEFISKDGKNLKIKAKDIAILVHANNHAEILKRKLNEYDIPCTISSNKNVFITEDALEIECVMQAMLHPRYELVKGALTTRLMGFKAQEIKDLTEEQMQLWVSKFNTCGNLWKEKNIVYALKVLINENHVVTNLLKLSDGERRLTNVMHIIECLREIQEIKRGPEAQLIWFHAQTQSDEENEFRELRLETDSELVTIMTIHKAKGLEFPIVFCPTLYALNSSSNEEFKTYYDEEAKQWVLDIDEENSNLIKEKIKTENKREKLRQIYVALTRAKYRCYLTIKNDSGKKQEPSPLNHLMNNYVIDNNTDDEKTTRIFQQTITDSPPKFVAQSFNQKIDDGWKKLSYSSLKSNLKADIDYTVDHDEMVVEHGDEDEESTVSNLHYKYRSASFGTWIHHILELVDYSDENTWESAINQYYYNDLLPEKNAKLIAYDFFNNIFNTELNDGLLLKNITKKQRFSEWKFLLDKTNVNTYKINRLLKDTRYTMAPIMNQQILMYLTGSIDVFFEYNGRFYIIDWKSNTLGEHVTDYNTHSINNAMSEHSYYLQSLIYTVALNTYLETKIENYDFNKHFGGVYYIFIRGVDRQHKQENGLPMGVYFDKPDTQLINDLTKILTNKK